MRKLIIILAVVLIIIGVFFLASCSEKEVSLDKYLDRAAFYGFKDFVIDEKIEVKSEQIYSHSDFAFWGIPDVN